MGPRARIDLSALRHTLDRVWISTPCVAFQEMALGEEG